MNGERSEVEVANFHGQLISSSSSGVFGRLHSGEGVAMLPFKHRNKDELPHAVSHSSENS